MDIIIFWTWQFGHVLSSLAEKNGHTVISWSFRLGTSIAELPNADIYISTLNASGLENVWSEIMKKVAGKPIISTTKAFIHTDSLEYIFPSAILGDSALVLSWPNLASEMLLWLPTGATLSGDRKYFDTIQKILETPNFFLEYSLEKRSIELMGIMKNIIAIGIGMIDGLWLGENLKWVFIAKMCKCIKELAREEFHTEFDITTLYAGIGDLFTTCSSTESRNHGFGLYLARTKSIKTASEFMNTSIEWLWSIEVLRPLLPERYIFLSGFLKFFDNDGAKVEKEEFLRMF